MSDSLEKLWQEAEHLLDRYREKARLLVMQAKGEYSGGEAIQFLVNDYDRHKRKVAALAASQPATQPWIYAIRNKDGEWQCDENCVFGDRVSCQDAVDERNDEFEEGEKEYFLVPLYRESPPAAPAAAGETGPTADEIYRGGIYNGKLAQSQEIERLREALRDAAVQVHVWASHVSTFEECDNPVCVFRRDALNPPAKASGTEKP